MNAEIPRSFDEARPHLRPLVRGRWHLDMPRLQAELQGATFSGHLASMPFSHDAVIVLGYDMPDRTLQIDPDHLAGWGISFQEGLKAAMQNLRLLSEPKFHALASGARVSDWPDGHDASRILLPDVIRQCGIDDDLVMMMPSRRAGLLVAPAASVDAQRWMLDCARQLIQEHGGLISAAMYRYQDRRVVTYLPQDAQLAAKLEDVQKTAASAIYGEQKTLLEALHARQGKDLFVAGYQVAERPAGALSACSWTRGITSLLPRTDLVSMVELDPRGVAQPRVKILDWETMRSLAGHLLQPTDHFPPRFLVSGFPSDEALARAPAFKI